MLEYTDLVMKAFSVREVVYVCMYNVHRYMPEIIPLLFCDIDIGFSLKRQLRSEQLLGCLNFLHCLFLLSIRICAMIHRL